LLVKLWEKSKDVNGRMKMLKYKLILTVALLIVVQALCSYPPNPRAVYFRLLNEDGSSLQDERSSLVSISRLFDVEKNHETKGFGFVYGNGDMFAKFELGNFQRDWLPGDTLSIAVFRSGGNSSMVKFVLPIPEGSDAIWWGYPDTAEKDYPGEPLSLLPCVLKIETDNKKDAAVFQNGNKIGQLKDGVLTIEKFAGDPAGEYHLEAPAQGWHWEPASKQVSLDDFTLQAAKEHDKDGRRDIYGHGIQFRLVKDE